MGKTTHNLVQTQFIHALLNKACAAFYDYLHTDDKRIFSSELQGTFAITPELMLQHFPKLHHWCFVNLARFLSVELAQNASSVSAITPATPASSTNFTTSQHQSTAIQKLQLVEGELLDLASRCLSLVFPLALRRDVRSLHPQSIVKRAMLQVLAHQAIHSGQPAYIADTSGRLQLHPKSLNQLSAGSVRAHSTVHLDGHTFCWVELLDSQALAYEGMHMRHCVASFHQELKTGSARFFSLRSEQGTPKITIEVLGNQIAQIKARAQTLPKPKYIPAIEAFLRVPIGFSFLHAHACQDLLDMGVHYDTANSRLISLNSINEQTVLSLDVHVWDESILPSHLNTQGFVAMHAPYVAAKFTSIHSPHLYAFTPQRVGSEIHARKLSFVHPPISAMPSSCHAGTFKILQIHSELLYPQYLKIYVDTLYAERLFAICLPDVSTGIPPEGCVASCLETELKRRLTDVLSSSISIHSLLSRIWIIPSHFYEAPPEIEPAFAQKHQLLYQKI